jgi:salicylate hydroxylase
MAVSSPNDPWRKETAALSLRGEARRDEDARRGGSAFMPDTLPHVIIAGAGIGGLTAGLALLKAGIDCDLYEQASELREVGAGLQLAPNGTRVLFALGLEPSVRRDGVETGDKVVRLWSTGQTWSLFDPTVATPIERFGSPMYLMHRGDLHAMLVDAVRREKPSAIHLNARCVDCSQDDAQARLLLEDGRTVAGGILIGADGLHSRIREKLFGPAAPTFTGILAWRGLARMERLPEHLRKPVTTQWLGPNGHVTCYPVRRGEFLNLVGEVERDDWRKESWVEPGTHVECLQDFPGWHRDLLDIIDNIDRLYKWGLFLREPLPKWSVGRISLLGDACHAMLPFLGQGANMALEDGYLLARCVSKYGNDPVVALQRYEAARRERTTNVVQRSAAMAQTFHNEALADDETGASYISKQWSLDNIRTRYDTIYKYDVTAIAI